MFKSADIRVPRWTVDSGGTLAEMTFFFFTRTLDLLMKN